MLTVSRAELRHETNRQLGRLHDDESKNTGFVQVAAKDMQLILDELENLERKAYDEPRLKDGDKLSGVECPECGHSFDHTVVL